MDSVIYFNLKNENLSIKKLKNLVFEDAPYLKAEGSKLIKYVNKTLKCAIRSKIEYCPEINELYSEISKVIKRKISPISPFGEIVKYVKGGFVKPHQDIDKSFTTNTVPRTLIYYLKPAEKGGETIVDKIYQCSVGDVIIFDKSLTHSCSKILEGEKIIFIGDIFIECETDFNSFLKSKELFLPVGESILKEKIDPSLSILSGTLFDFNTLSVSDDTCECPKLKHAWKFNDLNKIYDRTLHKSDCENIYIKPYVPFIFLDNKFIIKQTRNSRFEWKREQEQEKNISSESHNDPDWVYPEISDSDSSDEEINIEPLLEKYTWNFPDERVTLKNYKLLGERKDYAKTASCMLSLDLQLKIEKVDLKINYKFLNKFEDFLFKNYSNLIAGKFDGSFEMDWGRDSYNLVNCNTFVFYFLVKNKNLGEHYAAKIIQKNLRQYIEKKYRPENYLNSNEGKSKKKYFDTIYLNDV